MVSSMARWVATPSRPTLNASHRETRNGDIVAMDNLSSHKGRTRQRIEAVGALSPALSSPFQFDRERLRRSRRSPQGELSRVLGPPSDARLIPLTPAECHFAVRRIQCKTIGRCFVSDPRRVCAIGSMTSWAVAAFCESVEADALRVDAIGALQKDVAHASRLFGSEG
jgi:hypothetical protein